LKKVLEKAFAGADIPFGRVLHVSSIWYAQPDLNFGPPHNKVG
jgi:hypothetical protein